MKAGRDPRIPLSPPLWISHRGNGTPYPENTMAAFREAVRAGFSVLETDLRLSRDGHIVLAHDPTLQRLCGDPRRVRDLYREELERVRLPGGHRLLFFDEFAEAFAGVRWVLDVKPEHGEETIRALQRWAAPGGHTEGLQTRTTFLAWTAGQERMLKRWFPRAAFYPHKWACVRAGLAAVLNLPGGSGIRPGSTYGLPPRLGPVPLYRESIVRYYRRRKARLLAFLPGTEGDVGDALRLGFDEILSEHPRPATPVGYL